MTPKTTSDYIAIAGLGLAVYGAVVSTINSVIQYIAHRRDRADVVIKVRRNMKSSNDRIRAGMTLTLVTATIAVSVQLQSRDLLREHLIA